MTEKTTDLNRLFKPKHIAFVGGNDAILAIERCVEFGFTGEIWPVHPKREEMAGYKCYASLEDLPEPPDASFVAVNRDLSVQIVGELSGMGAGGCVCYAAGYAELGGDGIAAQAALIEASGDMPLVGPNCFGFVNYMDRVALWPYLFADNAVQEGVALVSQSGNIAMNLTMNQRSIPFTHVIGAGNQAVLGVPEFIDALLEDERVKAIALYLEGLDDVAAFAKSAMRALEKGVPIVALKVGVSDLGARQASSHTSSLVGADGLYNTLFKRTGVIRVQSLNALLETVKMFAICGPIEGNKMTSMSCSGGEAALVADLADRFDMVLPDLSKSQTETLSSFLGKYVTVSNPLDYNTAIWADFDAMKNCFATMMSGDFDVNCLIYDYPTIPFSKEVAEWDLCLDAYIAAHNETGRPAVMITTISELIPESARKRMIANGVVPLQGSEEALIAMSSAAWYGKERSKILLKNNLPKKAPQVDLDRPVLMLNEWDSKESLSHYGLTTPEGAVVKANTAAAKAAELGFPVVVKAVGDNLAHKTELGAVALNLKTEDAVEQAVARIGKSVQHLDGLGGNFLVEKMVSGSIAELIVGVKRDDQFGPVLVIGAGGVLVELMEDSQTLLLPVGREDVSEALESLKVYKLLNGFRGAEIADIDAVIDSVMAVANYAMDHWDKIEELDVNPLMVSTKGNGAFAADAVIQLAKN